MNGQIDGYKLTACQVDINRHIDKNMYTDKESQIIRKMIDLDKKGQTDRWKDIDKYRQTGIDKVDRQKNIYMDKDGPIDSIAQCHFYDIGYHANQFRGLEHNTHVDSGS